MKNSPTPKLRLCCLASGSSGNCTYIGQTGGSNQNPTHLLIDAGISAKRIRSELSEIGVKLSDINAILLTHEHSDHVSGLKVLLNNSNIPIYASAGTLKGIRDGKCLPACYDESGFRELGFDGDCKIGSLTVKRIKTSHDSNESCGFRIFSATKSVAVLTDLGCFTRETVEALNGVELLVLEANHDPDMVKNGNYHYRLKQRVLSDCGHLSNENAARLLADLYHENMSAVILGHLSKENNIAELAYETVRTKLYLSGKRINERFRIVVAGRNERTQAFEV